MTVFPPFFAGLPEADIPLEGVRARLVRGEGRQVVFMEFDRDVTVPEHVHGAQWGVVLRGRMELVVSGVARGCTRGETYFVPAGTPHAARIEAGYADVSVFDEPGRYAPRPRPGAPVEVCGIDHVVLTVRDVAATCDFYRRALGMRVVEFDGRRALAFGGQKINLHEAGGGPEPKAAAPTPGSADLCLVTSTPVPEILGHLEREGIPVVEGPVRRSGALGPMTSVYLRDPDGNLVEVSRYEA